jgi:hypothetical protein
MMAYEEFKAKIVAALSSRPTPLTWTEVRTLAGLPQLFPNNQWVHRLEKDVGLNRQRESDGVIKWQLTGQAPAIAPTKASKQKRPRQGRKQGAME